MATFIEDMTSAASPTLVGSDTTPPVVENYTLGPQGPKGDTGARGLDGARGVDGIPGMAVVHHGTNGATARPASPLVYWLGTATPANAVAWDIWLKENI